MICKNCKTAVFESDTVCKTCGKSLKKSNYKLAIGVLAGVLVISAALYGFRDKLFEPGRHEPFVSEGPAPNTTDVPVKPPTPKDGELIAQSEPPTPVAEKVITKTEEEVKAMLENLVEAVSFYYDKYREQTVFLTKRGYLYDFPAEAYVTVSDLFQVTTPADPLYEKENVLFFYLKRKDLGSTPLKATDGNVDDDKLEIFAGVEVHDGYYLISADKQGGIISREALSSILEKYNYDFGEIIRYSENSEEYADALKAVGDFTNSKAEYDVRYLAGDNRYSYLAVSEKGKESAITQYILMQGKNTWTVVLNGFDSEFKYKELINSAYPDLNFAMLPKFNLYYSLKFMKSEFKPVFDAMKKDGYVSESNGPVVFSSGTSEFVYVEYKDGAKFVGNLQEGTWIMYPVRDYKEAELLLQSLSHSPPLHIIRQS